MGRQGVIDRMNKNTKRHLAFMLSAILIYASFGLPSTVNAQDAAARQKIINHYQKAIEIIREKYIDQFDDETLTTSSLQGMLKSLDPHSDYLDRKSFQEFSEKQNSEYYGIGSHVWDTTQETCV